MPGWLSSLLMKCWVSRIFSNCTMFYFKFQLLWHWKIQRKAHYMAIYSGFLWLRQAIDYALRFSEKASLGITSAVEVNLLEGVLSWWGWSSEIEKTCDVSYDVTDVHLSWLVWLRDNRSLLIISVISHNHLFNKTLIPGIDFYAQNVVKFCLIAFMITNSLR